MSEYLNYFVVWKTKLPTNSVDIDNSYFIIEWYRNRALLLRVKTASNYLTSSHIDYILRYANISNLNKLHSTKLHNNSDTTRTPTTFLLLCSLL